jgi:hypothetical protein
MWLDEVVKIAFLTIQMYTNLTDGEPQVKWNSLCRFALVIFSVVNLPKIPSCDSSAEDKEFMDVDVDTDDDKDNSLHPDQVPWTFEHVERPGKTLAVEMHSSLHCFAFIVYTQRLFI